MELMLPTIEVLEDQRVTVQEMEWYGQQLVGIALVSFASYVLWKITDRVLKEAAQ